MLSLYLRPWTLIRADASEACPLLTNLRRVEGPAVEEAKTTQKLAAPKRRLQKGPPLPPPASAGKQTESMPSYVTSWSRYITGNVVSEFSRRIIMNFIAATAARTVEKDDSSDEDSDVSDIERYDLHAGSMDVVHDTLRGIATRDEEDGAVAVGRHAASIQMGRAMWSSPELTAKQKALATEKFFGGTSWPSRTDEMQQQWPDTDDEHLDIGINALNETDEEPASDPNRVWALCNSRS